MGEIKKNESYISVKNYVIAAVILIAAILITLYGFSWYKVIREDRVSTSYLLKNKVITKEIHGIKDLDDVFSEVPADYFVYISYTGNVEIYDMEKDLKDVINEYSLNDVFYYLNVTDIKDDGDYLNDINKAFHFKEDVVANVPTILYFKDGKIKDAIKKKDGIINSGDFEKLLEVNKIVKE